MLNETAKAQTSALPAPLRKIKTALTYPGAFFRYQSQNARAFYHGFAKIAHIKTYMQRCNSNADNYSQKKLKIEEDNGYAIFSPNEIPDNLAREVIEEVNLKLEKIDIEGIRNTAKKPYLLSVINADEISRDSAIYKLVSHPEIIGCVARYFKCFPILTYISVWYSPNLAGQETGSQKYHLDHEDFRQIKGFMFIKDVRPQNGPFTLISASESEKIQKELNYKMTPDNKQIDDDRIYNIVDKAAAKPLVGDAGTMALVDTSRCFHYGSREGTAPRVMLAFQYVTPFAYIMPWNWQKKTLLPHLHHPAMTQQERKLLGVEI